MEKEQVSTKTAIIVLVVMITFAMVAIGYVIYVVASPSRRDVYHECYAYAQQLARAELKSPDSAEFPWYDESFITDNQDTVTVTAYVDAENSFGAKIRTKFVATMTITNDKPSSGYVLLSQ